MSVQKYAALFLDRDGTINEDVGDLYRIEDLVFIPRSLDALRILQHHFLLFIITNQSGIGRGSFSEEEYFAFRSEYDRVLRDAGIEIIETLHCPHIPEDRCSCRKPSSHFIDLLTDKYNIDLQSSFSIGDHPGDVEMGQARGARGIYLLTGHGRKHRDELITAPDYIADDLFSACDYILL